jgi:hypothetical protein
MVLGIGAASNVLLKVVFASLVPQFRQGIHVGQPVVLELAENHDLVQMHHDDPSSALELLTQSYVASSEAHLQLGDLDSARKDAWFACMVTNNEHRAGLECMLQVCNVAGDRIGELCTLKLLLEQTKQEQRRRQQHADQDQDGVGNLHVESASWLTFDEDMELIQLSRRIAEVQRYLDNELAERLGKNKSQTNAPEENYDDGEEEDSNDDMIQ